MASAPPLTPTRQRQVEPSGANASGVLARYEIWGVRTVTRLLDAGSSGARGGSLRFSPTVLTYCLIDGLNFGQYKRIEYVCGATTSTTAPSAPSWRGTG